MNPLTTALSPLRLLSWVYPLLSVVGQYPLGQVAGIPLSLERVVLLLLGPLCLLQAAGGGPNVHRILRFTPGAVVAGLGLWTVGLALSCAVNHTPGDVAVFGGYVQKLLLGGVFAIAVAAEADAFRAVRVFALATLAATVATFHVFVTQGSVAVRAASFVNPDFGDVTIVQGLARAGAVGSVPLLACWLEAVYARRPRARFAWYLGVAVLFAAALLALRREYLLSIVLCLVWGTFTLPLGMRRGPAVLLLGGFLAFGFAIVAAVPEWRHRLLSETVETFAVGQDLRLLMLQTAPHLFLEEPVTGHGLGSFQWLMARSLPVQFTNDEEMRQFLAQGLVSHNSFLTAGIEGGFVPLVGISLFFGALAVWSLRVWRGARYRGGSPLALFAPLFFIQIFFSVFFQDGLASNMVWTHLGLLVAIIAIERSKPVPANWRRGPVPGRREPPASSHVRNPGVG